MKIAVGFSYVLWMVIYLSPLVPGNEFWYGMDKIMQTAFVGALSYFLQSNKKNTDNERLFFEYLTFLSLANAIYLAFCLYKNTSFAIYNTPIFAYVMGIGFIAFLVHCAINKKE